VVHAVVALGLLAGACVLGFRAAAQSPATPAAPKKQTRTSSANANKKAAKGEAKIVGKVELAGAAPAPEPWGGAHNNECGKLREGTIALVRAKDRKLADAFVYVKDGLPDGSYDAPAAPVRIDQKGCEFSPRVLGVMVGQSIQIGNDDGFLHNVSWPEFNQAFKRGDTRTASIDSPAVMVTMKCDVHPWMRAYAGVLEHPYFAVTGEDGAFRIDQLPDGEYTVAVWHEKLGTAEAKVKTTAAAGGTAEFTLQAK
jgi:plastocyanin